MADQATAFLWLAALLFTLGAVGVIIRRGAIVMLMCIELMLNAANLALVAAGRYLPTGKSTIGVADGQVLAFFVLAVAASEAAVGLGIVIALFRLRGSTDTDLARLLKW